MAFNLTQALLWAGVNDPAPHLMTVPTLAARDAIEDGVVRVGSSVYVAATGLQYLLASTGPNVWTPQTDHIADAANPHATSLANIGSGTLAQLNAAVIDGTLDTASDNRTDANALHVNVVGEINGLTLKATPVGTDVIVVEDSAGGFAKVGVALSSLGVGGAGSAYSVVGTTAERDALTPATGDIVRVLARSASYMWDGAAWRTVDKGNVALRAILFDDFAIHELNADADAGSDETGDGSQGSPYASHQRCIDELPPGISGTVVIHTRGGVQSQTVVDISHLSGIGSAGITIFIVGDTTSVEQINCVTGNGQYSNTTNPNAGSYVSARRIGTAAAYATSIDERVHFLYQPFDYLGTEYPQAYSTVGTVAGGTSHESNSAFGEIGVLAPFDISGLHEIVAITTTITPSPADAGTGSLVCLNKNYGDGVYLSYFGCEFLGTDITFQSVGVNQCRVNNRDAFFYGKCSIAIQKSGTGDVYCLSPMDTTIAGTWEAGNLRIDDTSFKNDAMGAQVLQLGPVLMRGADATKVRISNNQYGRINIILVVGCDFIGGGTAAPFYVRNSKVNFAAANAVGIEATINTVVDAQLNSQLVFNGDAVYGETSSVCVTLDKGSSADGLAGLVNLTSAVGATNEVRLGAATAQAFTAGPAGDLNSLCRFN